MSKPLRPAAEVALAVGVKMYPPRDMEAALAIIEADRAAALETAARLVQQRMHAACIPSHLWIDLCAQIRAVAQLKEKTDE